MFYKIKDNVFNINEVLFIDNQNVGINIVFNNGSKLNITYLISDEYHEEIRDYKLLCDELLKLNNNINLNNKGGE